MDTCVKDDAWMYRRMDEWTDGWMEGWQEGRKEGRKKGKKNERTYKESKN